MVKTLLKFVFLVQGVFPDISNENSPFVLFWIKTKFKKRRYALHKKDITCLKLLFCNMVFS